MPFPVELRQLSGGFPHVREPFEWRHPPSPRVAIFSGCVSRAPAFARGRFLAGASPRSRCRHAKSAANVSTTDDHRRALRRGCAGTGLSSCPSALHRQCECADAGDRVFLVKPVQFRRDGRSAPAHVLSLCGAQPCKGTSGCACAGLGMVERKGAFRWCG